MKKDPPRPSDPSLKDPSLKDLQEKIDRLQASHRAPLSGDSSPSPMGKYLTVGVELVSGILVGIGAGLVFDWLMNTRPLFLIIFFLFGSGAGMLNVYRALVRQGTQQGTPTEKNETQRVGEDKGKNDD